MHLLTSTSRCQVLTQSCEIGAYSLFYSSRHLMDLQPHSEAEYALASTTNTTGSAPYASAFFPQASGFNIRGGVFAGSVTNVYNPHPEQPSDFQKIRLGDVKLVKEVRLSLQSGVVGRQSRRVGVRQIYHAEIRRDPGTVTIAMYQGDGAEEEWRQHVAKYESIRHPNIMQLYGLVSTKGLYAMDYNNPPVWIRPSTGELCLDLVQGGAATNFELPWWQVHILRVENISLDSPDSEDMIISSLREDQYHKLCSGYPIARSQWFQVSTEHLVGPGIFTADSQHRTCLRITEPLILPEEELYWVRYERVLGELMPNSWIRYDSRQISTFKLELQLLFSSYEIQKAWLAQANHIFAELQERKHVEDYVCVDDIRFALRCLPMTNKSPIDLEGYLFVCPPRDFRTGAKNANLYQWPACPAYWCLDPSGAPRLSSKDARILGFPAIHIETVMAGKSWDQSVYKGLRRFHEGKEFDPESREVASQLGYPLYDVLSDLDSGTSFPSHSGELHLDGLFMGNFH
ncbi:hypothetical protein MSAN_01517500 [Mycena sanguinolenta]|uniref:Protein kinase domain-containing protein n=1 Tax=Mycena sanguinolenta TaxID=230812 RepID=A0A8H6Y377_9AGAR|nr:hypothetical protein MSAN_01517500 [Mycena sanguinolenta]